MMRSDSPENGSPAVRRNSYQAGDGIRRSSRRRSSSSRHSSSSSSSPMSFLASRRGSIAQAIKRAFSIDQYMPTGGDDDDDSFVDEGVRPFDDMELNPPIHQSYEWGRLRIIGLSILAVLVASSIAVAVSARANATKEIPVDEDEIAICNDPIQSLRDAATVEGVGNGVVSADHPVCSQMGLEVLRIKQGNAVDAAVTVALCLGVANPGSSGLGGGAFMLIHADDRNETDSTNGPTFIDARTGPSPVSKSGKITEVIDCREIAPSKATTDMYVNEPDTASMFGGLAVGVPGELRCLELAHARYGGLPWRDLVEPVMRLATRGIEVNRNLAHEIQIMASRYNDSSPDYGLRNLITRGDSWTKPLREGELLQNQKLGEFLQDIMDRGSEAFYSGQHAEDLAKDIEDAGGIVTKSDIEQYQATLRSPVLAHDVNGFSIAGIPPPSSGGAAIIGAARFLAGFSMPWASYPETISAHRFVEACKHAFAIRMSLSDPDYDSDTVADAVADLISSEYMENLRKKTRDNETLPLSMYGGSKWSQLVDSDGTGNATDAQEGDRRQRRRSLLHHFGYLNDQGTSHFSILDRHGNAVSMTTSINSYFGSKVVSRSTGIVLSNTMDDFANPGKANYFGLHPSEANYIKPGKKPLSSMAPTLVFQSAEDSSDGTLGELVLVVGSSGGPKIITAVLQVLLFKLMQGLSLFESMVHPRIHNQLIYHGASVTTTENGSPRNAPDTTIKVSDRTIAALERRGQRLIDIDYAGSVQAIAIDPETKRLTGVCDVRKGGTPAGY